MRVLAILVAFSTIACRSNTPASEFKQTIHGDSIVSSEDNGKAGVCLTRERKSQGAREACSESTYQSCRSQSSQVVSAVFVSSASCKCYALEQKFLAELNKTPFEDDSDISSDAADPIEIGGDWNQLYEKHPECKISVDNELLP